MASSGRTIAAGGEYDDSEGYFVRPTVLLSDDPKDEAFSTEYFGPILAVHVYEDGDFEAVVEQMESVADYALTGAVIAQDRAYLPDAAARLVVTCLDQVPEDKRDAHILAAAVSVPLAVVSEGPTRDAVRPLYNKLCLT